VSPELTASTSSVLFLSHGGGPMPLLGDEGHRHLVQFIQAITPTFAKPAAILLISAHWEEDVPTITSGASPALIYDYYGFPKEAYAIKYPAPGAPALAQQVFNLLKSAGIEARLDDKRGFDHGLFVPLKMMYPAADIPCVQLSLVNSLQAAQHIQIGKALAALRNDNVLIIGSGFSFHNMRAFFAPASAETQALNSAFEHWLTDTCASQQLTEAAREQRLIDWARAPGARFCHPREEHLLPLHVCYGVAGAAAKQVYEFEILGKMSSAYIW
jgi:4,5-DOPA dioxygenase extradiol